MRISDWSSDVCSSDLVRHVAVMIGAPTLMGALAGCVQIETPDKPIEINLNINIRQEVVYRLDGDAKKLIEQKDRKSVVKGKSVSVRLEIGGRRKMKKQHRQEYDMIII